MKSSKKTLKTFKGLGKLRGSVRFSGGALLNVFTEELRVPPQRPQWALSPMDLRELPSEGLPEHLRKAPPKRP